MYTIFRHFVWICGVFLFIGCEEEKTTTTSSTTSTPVTAKTSTPANNDLTGASYVGSQTCKTCHAADYAEWYATKHSTANFTSQTGDNCAICHATGFGLTGGYVSGSGAKDEVGMAGIQCEACHGPGSLHVDAAFADKPKTINKVPNAVTTCGGCHRGRPYFGIDLDDAAAVQAKLDTNIASSGTKTRHPIHHAPSLTLLKGVGGYEYAGSTYENSAHLTAVGNVCVLCHLTYDQEGNAKAVAAGKHDLAPDLSACQGCHSGLTTLNRDGKQTEIEGLLSSLKKELETYQEKVDLANRTDASYEQALWNYTLITEDLSDGIHNYKYAKKLLQDSIDHFDPVSP